MSSGIAAEPTATTSGVVLNNYEELMKQKDERIAILEYELRVAKEDIASQQAELQRVQPLMNSMCAVASACLHCRSPHFGP